MMASPTPTVQHNSATPAYRYSGSRRGRPGPAASTWVAHKANAARPISRLTIDHDERARAAPAVVVQIERIDLLVRPQGQRGQTATAAHIGPDMHTKQVVGAQQARRNHDMARRLGKVRAVVMLQVAVLLQQDAVEPDFIGIAEPGQVQAEGHRRRLCQFERQLKSRLTEPPT